MKELKILNIVTRLNIGGVSIHVVQISQMFNSVPYRSTVLYGDVEDNEKDMLYLAKEYDFPMINLPSMGRSINPLEDFLLIWKVYRVIKKLKPDIVHTHTAKAGFVGRAAAWLARTPIILHTFHGNNFSGYFGILMSTFSVNVERLMARISTRIIAISEQQRDELLRFRICPKAKTRIIHLGFDFSRITHSDSDVGVFKSAYSIPNSHKLIAFVGRLTAIKNPYQFIRIASAVLEDRQDVVFAFVGDGEMTEELKKEVRRLGHQENIIFTGFISDLKPLYADMDILLLTSLNEGTPVAIIEAMANRRLVVAAKVGGIPNL
ncbi:MAG: glycosyltransferase, partial [Candidatus Cloacimonadaceae bacterium]|nr:glycosyltransferase [Candidatus Cloacimonadaceae bacterium]